MKGKILMDSLTQLSDDHQFTAISEPDFNMDSVQLPEDGPMVFEFDIEVRPEFDLPRWKGLTLERPTHEYSDAEVEERLQQLLSKYGQLAAARGTDRRRAIRHDDAPHFVRRTAALAAHGGDDRGQADAEPGRCQTGRF